MNRRMIVGVFEREEDVLHATDAARTAGFHIVDAFGPYASHRLDRALGLPSSRLPRVCLLLGLIGAGAMTLFQFWTTAVSWPINVGGKPWNSLPAFVPATFEMMVLCAGVGTVAAFLWSAGLRPGRASALSGLGVTDDRFALVLREIEGASDRAAIEALLSRFHPLTIEERVDDLFDGDPFGRVGSLDGGGLGNGRGGSSAFAEASADRRSLGGGRSDPPAGSA